MLPIPCRTKTKFDKPWETYSLSILLTTSNYSQFRVGYTLGADSGWISSANICYERKTSHFHVYLLDGRRVDIRQYGKQCTSCCNISRLVFRYGWSFDFHKGPPPTANALWLNTTGNYIGVAFHGRHITHFAESINMLLLKLLAPAEFPQVRMAT